MAIKLNTSYSKKLGLPGYSSHSFSASVEVELGDINQASTECARPDWQADATSVARRPLRTAAMHNREYARAPAAARLKQLRKGA